MASKFALLLLSVSSLAISSLAAPASNGTETTSNLEKRVTHVGRGTWFDVGYGNCGLHNTNSQPIVAISKARYDANGGGNCGQWMVITNTANGKTAYGLTEDSCESCGTEDIDMSPSLFQQLDALSVGVLKVSWHFQAMGWAP